MKLSLKGAATGMLAAMAQEMGAKVVGGKLTIPRQYGSGYLQGYLLANGLRLMVRDYELNEEQHMTRSEAAPDGTSVIFSFHNVFSTTRKKGRANTGEPGKAMPTVQIAIGGMRSELFYPSRTRQQSIVIGMTMARLKELAGQEEEGELPGIPRAIAGPQFVEEPLPPKVVDVANEIVAVRAGDAMHRLLLSVKAQELVYIALSALQHREPPVKRGLSEEDLQAVMRARDELLADLSAPPTIAQLAHIACMSESKLKRLFVQVFGTAVLGYFQQARMREACRLLREEKRSVSDTGYSLGFTNLSHFTRVFEEHTGMKPKKYSMQA